MIVRLYRVPVSLTRVVGGIVSSERHEAKRTGAGSMIQSNLGAVPQAIDTDAAIDLDDLVALVRQ
jgi:hypothetical protein